MFIKSKKNISIILILLNLYQCTNDMPTREEVSKSTFRSFLLCTETIFDDVREGKISDLDRERQEHKEDMEEKNSRRNNTLYWMDFFNKKKITDENNVNYTSKWNNRKKIRKN